MLRLHVPKTELVIDRKNSLTQPFQYFPFYWQAPHPWNKHRIAIAVDLVHQLERHPCEFPPSCPLASLQSAVRTCSINQANQTQLVWTMGFVIVKDSGLRVNSPDFTVRVPEFEWEVNEGDDCV